MKLMVGIIRPDNSLKMKRYYSVGKEVTIEGNTYLVEGKNMLHRNMSFNRTWFYMFFMQGNPKSMTYDDANRLDFDIIQTLLQDHTARDVLGKPSVDKSQLYMMLIMGLVFGLFIGYIVKSVI
jgi:hypothetical protein